MVYTVTLNPSLDYTVGVDGLSEDINRTTYEDIRYGGKGINVSVVLARLGVATKALGFAAGFTGRELLSLLEKEGVESDFVFLGSGNTRINLKIKAQKEININARGAEVSEKELEALLEKLKGVQSGDFVVLSGSVPKGIPQDVYENILALLDGKNINAVIDAEGELLQNALKYKPFLVKPNHLELGALFNTDAGTDGEVERCARLLQSRGAKNVLVSRAEKGALLLDESGAVHIIGNAEGTAVDTNGCGDSTVAGFIAGYLQNGDYSVALKLATACGNATAYSEGLATKKEVEKYYLTL